MSKIIVKIDVGNVRAAEIGRDRQIVRSGGDTDGGWFSKADGPNYIIIDSVYIKPSGWLTTRSCVFEFVAVEEN